ncbi:MAG: glycosyltransferase [Acidobacteria bacterium]|nr:glycosyltransferase [Acidobacteriota bacterium]
MLAEIAPGYPFIHVIPNSIDLSRYERLAEEKIHGSLIFTGSLRYNANLDAMDWFLKDIYPMIQSRGDDVSLTITGDPGCGKLPDASNVVQTGRVEDVREWVSAAMVSIAPIRMGGGTRFKILESFALRTPVVATSKAVEGIEAKNGEHLLLADAPEDFARSVLRLLDNPAEAYQMADKAFDLVRARYDWRTLSQKFLHLVDQAVHNFCNP